MEDAWFCLVQLPDTRCFPRLRSSSSPSCQAFPQTQNRLVTPTRSPFLVIIQAPAPPPLPRKTKPQPLWGPEEGRCEVNPVLPPLFHIRNPLLVWRELFSGNGLGMRSTNSCVSWVRDLRISTEVHRQNLLHFQETWLWFKPGAWDSLSPAFCSVLLFDQLLCLAFLSVAQMLGNLVRQKKKFALVKKTEKKPKRSLKCVSLLRKILRWRLACCLHIHIAKLNTHIYVCPQPLFNPKQEREISICESNSSLVVVCKIL